MLKLMIGSQRFSSWSMRPWLLMRQLGIPFEAEKVPYTRPDWHAVVKARHAAGTVPVLLLEDYAVGDTMAIAETLAELHPQAGVWPAEPKARAQARSLCAEMHSSFGAVREECTFDAYRKGPPRPLSPRAQAQFARIDAIFSGAEDGFLFGGFCAADAFYAPVALRTRQYQVELSPAARAYVERIAGLASVQEWLAQAETERAAPPVRPGGAPYHQAMVSVEDALRFATHWVAVWNKRDLEAVLELFTENAVFVSPKAAALLGQARIEGKAGLRRYWGVALEKIQHLEFKLETADWDPASSTATVIYEADLAGKRSRAAERWVLDATGKIRYGEAYYGAPL